MKLVLEEETRIRLEVAGDGFQIVAEKSAISPYHLLAGALASCIALLEQSWAEKAGVDWTPLQISVAWEFTNDHAKVATMDARLRWPGLPDSRAAVVRRIAELCPVEETLRSGTVIRTDLEVD